jgi:N-glycosylase/DNA lyase
MMTAKKLKLTLNQFVYRISQLVEKVCTKYGQLICHFKDVDYYNFPDIAAMRHPHIEQELRDASFGYRAKYIQKCAEEITAKGGLAWFEQLQRMDYKQAHTELVTLTGIGPKVADCICLMSLNHLQAIPVDTHVFQIAQHYLPHIAKLKTVTGKAYTEIGDKFREIYGQRAGWAQTVLFCADLRQFKDKKNEVVPAKRQKKAK